MQVEKITPQPIITGALTFGCDPEFFLMKDGNIIGSEKLIPEKGLSGTIVRDGIQVEMNPGSDYCRANLSNAMQRAFQTLQSHIAQSKSGIQVCFTTTHTIKKKEMDSLSEASKRLGCMPSHNIHGPATIKVNPLTYRRRSAGGHIHVGGVAGYKDEYKRELVQAMDILIGNTCVLIDRDPLAATRRRVYGRAGEYRLPKHGVEYRTLSNFWLHSYQLMSLVMGLARMSVSVIHTTHYASDKAPMIYDRSGKYVPNPKAPASPKWDAYGYLLSLVDPKKVRRAINKNDLDLAYENWAGVRKFISETMIPGSPQANALGLYYEMGLDATKLEPFEFFAKKVQEKGLSHWFPQDPLTHWVNKCEGHGSGWESWIDNVNGPVKLQMRLEAKQPEIPKNL